jgi:hypothetical protein
MLFTKPPKLKDYLFPFRFDKFAKTIKGCLLAIIIIFVLENSGLEYWVFKQQNHFSDCSYWKNKNDGDISRYFENKNDYVKTRAVNAFFQCHIKQATPFIVSTFTIAEEPPDKFNYMQMVLQVPWSYGDRIDSGLRELWGLPLNYDINHFQGQQTVDFWNQYYANHKYEITP